MTDAPFAKLNIRQQKFAEAYADHGNATKAAKDAGYSERTAHAQGCDLLKHPDVRAYIDAVRTERWQRAAMGPDEWRALVSQQARNPLKDLVHCTPDGDPYIDLANAPAEALQHVKKVTIEDFIDKRELDNEGKPIGREVRRVTLEMESPSKGREMIGRSLGVLQPERETVVVDFANLMMAASKRVEEGKKDDE